MLLANKKIVFIDDDKTILNVYKKYCNKLYPDNIFEYYEDYFSTPIDSSVDILVIDFYLGKKQNVPDLIKKIRSQHKNLLIIVVSSAVVIKDRNYTCYNNNLLRNSIMAGANNVIQKDVIDIIKLLEQYIIVRGTLTV